MQQLGRSEEHTSELQSHSDLVCRLLLEKKKKKNNHRLHKIKKHTKKKIAQINSFHKSLRVLFTFCPCLLLIFIVFVFFFFFFFNDTATTEIYTLSLHDALPIWAAARRHGVLPVPPDRARGSRHRSEEHTSELQSHSDLVCRLLLEKKKKT